PSIAEGQDRNFLRHRRTHVKLPTPTTSPSATFVTIVVAIRSFLCRCCRRTQLPRPPRSSFKSSSVTVALSFLKFHRHGRLGKAPSTLGILGPWRLLTASVRDRYLSVYNESFDRQNQADPSSHRNIGKKCSDAAASGTVTLGFLGFFCSSFFGAPYPVLLGSARGLHAAVIVLLVRRGRGRPRSGMALRRLRAFCSKESKPF
ncbi:hypothetical protein B296_00039335, partial [Ensete ventricosum]